MSELTDKEFEAIKQLNAEYRQAMFLNAVKELDGMFILVDDDGPVILDDTEEDENGNLFSVLPVWSAQRLAEDYAKCASLENARPQFVTRAVWNEKWVPSFAGQKLLVGFMPVEDKDFAVDDPAAF